MITVIPEGNGALGYVLHENPKNKFHMTKRDYLNKMGEKIELFPGVLDWFERIDEYGKRMSNGKIEGSNNKIKVIKRVSYGYSDFYHLRNRIMYIFNEDEKPLYIPKPTEKIKYDKIGHFKPRKKDKLK